MAKVFADYDAARQQPRLRRVWGRDLCGPCNDGAHKDCACGGCTCWCHERAPAKPKGAKQPKSMGLPLEGASWERTELPE